MQMLKKGSTVIRDIEGLCFVAVIQDVYLHDNCATIKYIDDGNIECDVSLDVLQLADDASRSTIPIKKDTLRKPLAGLVEDDSDTRNKHTPTVFIHSSDNTDEAIIMNGAENKQPAGGGLRALRHLRK